MFTGLVVETGFLRKAPTPSSRGGVRLEIRHSPELAERLPLGASVAVNGVCLTVTERGDGWSSVELSPETLCRTSLESLADGSEVNLEPALRLGDPLGGHWVQGHVDTTVGVLHRRQLGEHTEVAFELPPELAALVVEKGSVTLDGVSLTISSLAEDRFEVALIPHTLDVTTLSHLCPGQRVNLEIDILGKYVQRALEVRGLGNPGRVP